MTNFSTYWKCQSTTKLEIVIIGINVELEYGY